MLSSIDLISASNSTVNSIFEEKKILNYQTETKAIILPYFGKRKQVTKVTFLVKEQNVSVISTDVNGIS